MIYDLPGGIMSYTKKKVAEVTGLTPRLVQFYTERGVVTPEVDEGRGRGRFRLYSRNNILEFAVINELVSYGMTVYKIGVILQALRDSGFLNWQGLYKTDAFVIIYQRENARYIKPDFRLSYNKPLELKKIDGYDSALVINLGQTLSRLKT